MEGGDGGWGLWVRKNKLTTVGACRPRGRPSPLPLRGERAGEAEVAPQGGLTQAGGPQGACGRRGLRGPWPTTGANGSPRA